MRYLSVCSGIEAASVAWHHLGWEPVGFSEIEPFPAAVLAHRFPNIPNFGDMTQHEQWPLRPGSIDLLVGGTPCQSYSVAGLRQGLADPRGSLMLTYLAIADRLRPRWLVWENVPGVLSSNGGRDFGTFLGALGQLGYGWAYRVLDAQYIRVGRWPRAVPQRRRRVFVVGRLIERGARDWAAPGEVLALAEGLQRNLEARRAKGKGVAADAEGGVARCITTCEMKRQDYETCTMVAHAFYSTGGTHGVNQHSEVSPAVKVGSGLGIPSPPAVAFTPGNLARGAGASPNAEVSQTLQSQQGRGATDQHPCVAFQQNQLGEVRCGNIAGTVNTNSNASGRNTPMVAHAAVACCVAPTITAGNDPSRSPQSSEVTQQVAAVHAASMTVRRLTPRECERLQGFPDDWTMIPYRGKSPEDCPDGPRYKALGNSMACNCMAWIGERIAAYEAQNGST